MKITALRGYRFSAPDGSDVSAVVAPPYDQISPEMQAQLYAMSPANIVRATLPMDDPAADKYALAAEVLDRWIAEGVWARDPAPAIYPYQQTYAIHGQTVTRSGFVALGELSDYQQGIVLPHEQTHSGPKRDRLRLLEATGADIGLLFMLVGDPGGELQAATTPTGPPIAEARDLRGEHHRLWRITDPVAIGQVCSLMAPRQVIIADGHHRYETAVDYARTHPEAREKLMAFFALEAPGLTILANHRLVRGIPGFSALRLLDAARPWFDARPLDDPHGFHPAPRRMGFVTREGSWVLRLRDDALDHVPWPLERSRAWRELAVSILHEAVLRPLLGITHADLEARKHVDYTADQDEAVRLAGEAPYQAAFLIAPCGPEELAAVVQGGELLPQKSTHFYPKLLDGLVFHRLGGPDVGARTVTSPG